MEEKAGWLKRIMEDASREVEKRPTWMKPAELRRREIQESSNPPQIDPARLEKDKDSK
jgi:hypothetical protein